MGTNYYTVKHCPTCGHKEEDKHLGKSSGGWTFTFQWNGGKYYKNYEEMIEWLKGRVIADEYGTVVSLDDFIAMVEIKKNDVLSHAKEHESKSDFMIDGHSFSDHEFC